LTRNLGLAVRAGVWLRAKVVAASLRSFTTRLGRLAARRGGLGAAFRVGLGKRELSSLSFFFRASCIIGCYG